MTCDWAGTKLDLEIHLALIVLLILLCFRLRLLRGSVCSATITERVEAPRDA
jgi:hypothetical protein